MKKNNFEQALQWHDENFISALDKRYITLEDISPLNTGLSKSIYDIRPIGISEQGQPVFRIGFGRGSKKILIWTQMHGNESTGTRAVYDLLHYFEKVKNGITETILSNCTITVIPMLNPDGAKAYTRVNALDIDLNRDAVDRKAKESKLLRDVLDTFNPDYNFNLHDQRTLFTAGMTKNPATISFLAPSEEVTRKVTEGRKKTMRVITAMNALLQEWIPGQIGRYTDEFYPTATGDTFQKLGFPTILIESGHFPGDYRRHNTRKYTFLAVLAGMYHIAKGNEDVDYREYFKIPQNEKNYLDLIVKGGEENGKRTDIGILFKEKLKNGRILFEPSVERKGDLSKFGTDQIIAGNRFTHLNESQFLKEIIKYTPYN